VADGRLTRSALFGNAKVPSLNAIGPIAVQHGQVVAFADERDHALRAVAIPLEAVPAEVVRLVRTWLPEQFVAARRSQNAAAVSGTDENLFTLRRIQLDFGPRDGLTRRHLRHPNDAGRSPGFHQHAQVS